MNRQLACILFGLTPEPDEPFDSGMIDMIPIRERREFVDMFDSFPTAGQFTGDSTAVECGPSGTACGPYYFRTNHPTYRMGVKRWCSLARARRTFHGGQAFLE